jgi:ribose/xylose/arabinose/galactoside ABC-type transport system permease subunit
MTLLNVSPYRQHVVLGAIILAAALVNQVQPTRQHSW